MGLFDTKFLSSPPPAGNVYDAASVSGTIVPLYEWSSPVKLDDPLALPTSLYAFSCSWHPSGAYLAIAVEDSPYLVLYERIGDKFVKIGYPYPFINVGLAVSFSSNGRELAFGHAAPPFIAPYFTSFNPTFGLVNFDLAGPLVPPTGIVRSVAWSMDTGYLAVAHTNSPYLSVYERTYNVSTANAVIEKIADPATLPTGNARGVGWSPDGRFVAVANHGATPLNIYELVGSTLIKLPDPSSMPTGDGRSCTFSPTGKFLAVTHTSSPFITIYEVSGSTFTKIADPDVLPSDASYTPTWTLDESKMAISCFSSPYIYVYNISGLVFTKLPDPDVLPSAESTSCCFTPDGAYLSLTVGVAPFVMTYKTSSPEPDISNKSPNIVIKVGADYQIYP
jgi:hypothetical protein